MTKKEAAIVSAYTGYLVGDFSEMHKYVEGVLGRPVWTHQFPELRERIKQESKADFVALSEDVDE